MCLCLLSAFFLKLISFEIIQEEENHRKQWHETGSSKGFKTETKEKKQTNKKKKKKREAKETLMGALSKQNKCL